jgi:hypothetical protein
VCVLELEVIFWVMQGLFGRSSCFHLEYSIAH